MLSFGNLNAMESRGGSCSSHDSVARGKPLSPRVVSALDSMEALAHFARAYERSAPIPDAIWQHAEIMSEYLGYPPAKHWLWTWLNQP